jgi:hypothetical protein
VTNVRQRRARRLVLAALEGSTGIAALGGLGYALAGAPAVPTAWLDRTPFRDYRVPGLVLGGVVGGTMLTASASVVRRDPHARALSTVAGLTLTAWIAAQVGMIGPRSWLQPAFFGVGLATIALARSLP